MKVFLVGSGGREDAIAWALRGSPLLERLDCAPGNAGIARYAECLDIAATDVEALVRRATAERYDLVVIGPEAPLVAGLADKLRQAGIAVFGPSAAAAVLEGSKAFSKRFMQRHGLPTARFEVFDEASRARAYLASDAMQYPCVVKADGLAAGKGVIVAADRGTATAAADSMLSGEAFGEAGRQVVIEEMLRGREASFFVLCDGERFVELATCQDYKRARDGDAGPNTGGMGTYSPSAYLDPAMRQSIVDDIVRPTIQGLSAEERPYRGVLYVGLMLTDEGPKILEYNVRFGDPETQVLMPRLEGDWLDLLHRCATGRLSGEPLRWKEHAAVCVVMAAEGYPGAYPKGRTIDGLEDAESMENVVVFHAGTTAGKRGEIATSGGRVLGVTALGTDLGAARATAYRAVDRIRWEGEHHRTDVALDAVQRLTGSRP